MQRYKNIIHHIEINQDKFIIHLMTKKMDIILIFSGSASTVYNTELEVYKPKHSINYKIVTDWINMFFIKIY